MKLLSPYKVFRIPFKWFTTVLLLILFPILLSVSFNTLVSFSFFSLLLKNLIDTIFMIGFAILLEKIIPFTNYVKLDFTQRIINFIALAVLTVSAWVTLTYLSSFVVFGAENREEFIKLIPITAFIGLLLYLIDILFINYRILKFYTANERDNKDKSQTENDTEDEFVEESIEIENEALERIAVKTGQKIDVILVPDIIYIKSDGDYVQIFTDKGKFIKEDTMKYFQANLPGNKFVRVHRSFIVNVEKIARIELYEKHSQLLLLKNGDQVKTSTSGYKMLREVLNL